ncbi:4-hydroxy-tetrahydrodipicolinate reductase [Acetobacter sp. AN02]|uniref:4-hydroxy-tetrahydrodipicolinate reductase n=1 Tax=Acetobacter sp. AN02 TaxID=2894186 RepID=UPI00243416CC|nr:4-hydroxy-tetrahydrodipicolinate reductase [Acetobacter sp. AN02]MDG6094898.1 4-hydroxy-tetrahydrodipicolinate reductase [Acetobacter sp. AN02]
MTSGTLRIGIAGIHGRMGRMLVRSVQDAPAACLSGGTALTESAPVEGAPVFARIEDLADVSDLVIDFTHVSTVAAHARALADRRTPWVLGTTGLSGQEQAAVVAAAADIPVIQAANFSPGVTLVLRLARQMGAALPARSYDAEIVEMHHRQKVDAPSGTALAIGEAVADGRDVCLSDVKESGRDGHTGARAEGAIGFAALRGGQIVGEHTLLFTSAAEQIGLTHRAFDRRVFSDGAVQAALWLAGHEPGLYDMENVLGLKS